MERTDCCSTPLSYGRRMLLVLAGGVLLVGSPGHVLAVEVPSLVSDTKPGLKTVVIPVKGMVCVACAATVRKALKSLDGVSSVEVSLEKRTAQVTYAVDKLSPDRMVTTVNKLGYKAGTPREIE